MNKPRRKHISRGIIRATAAVVAVGTASAMLTAPTAAAPTSTAAAGSERSAAKDEVLLRGARIQEALARTPHFGGVWLDESGDGYVINATDLNDENLRREADQARGQVPVRYQQVPHDWAELEALRERVTADQAELQASGISLVRWGPDARTGRLDVAIQRDDPSSAAELRSRYGSDIHVLVEPQPVRRASRLNDVSPWNGGDAISSDASVPDDCTAGPPVKSSSGKTYLLTAGHCYRTTAGAWTGNYIYRAFNGSDLLAGDNPRLMGNAAAELVDNGYDVALIDTNSSGLDWRTAGTNDSGTAVAQKKEFASTVGTSVCVSGAYSGERCSAVVSDVDQTVNIDGIRTIRTVIATHPNGVDLAGPADSGAPVYTVQSTGLFLTGLFYAGTGGLNCTRNNTGYRVGNCGATIYYQNLSSVLNHRGITLYLR